MTRQQPGLTGLEEVGTSKRLAVGGELRLSIQQSGDLFTGPRL
ncbi:hypothetical protein [Corallococcus exercitus]|nr:hypothetical protein [Corallococcus exercitus]